MDRCRDPGVLEAWSRACPRLGCCFSSTTGRSISTPGAAGRTTASSGSTPCRPRAPNELLAALLGDDPGSEPLKRLLIDADRRQSLLPRGKRADAGRDEGAGGRAGAYRLGEAIETLQIPATAQAILAARIDRLGARGEAPAPDRLGRRARTCRSRSSAPSRSEPTRISSRGSADLQRAEFLYESQPLPGSRVHLQARAHPRGGVRRAPHRTADAPSTHGSSRRSRRSTQSA